MVQMEECKGIFFKKKILHVLTQSDYETTKEIGGWLSTFISHSFVIGSRSTSQDILNKYNTNTNRTPLVSDGSVMSWVTSTAAHDM